MSTSDRARLAQYHNRRKTRQQQIELANELKLKGNSNAAIANIIGISENTVRGILETEYAPNEIVPEETIWYPGVYGGRLEGDWTRKVSELSKHDYAELIGLVQQRAKEDGDWTISNGKVAAENQIHMRKMIAWVSDERNIKQCVEHIYKEGMENERTVDWVCRDLANASKNLGGVRRG